jgi:hypothetical protein
MLPLSDAMADAPRRFRPPWRVDKIPDGHVVCDANGQALAYVYSRALHKKRAAPGRQKSPQDAPATAGAPQRPTSPGAQATGWRTPGHAIAHTLRPDPGIARLSSPLSSVE